MSNYTVIEKQMLLKTADAAIRFGLAKRGLLPIKLEEYPEKLQLNGASFVTLEIDQKLRGCIGALEAYQPLIQDLVQNSYAAAFRDPRFSPLTIEEYPKVTKQISILSQPSSLSFTSEEDLLRQLRPGIDGLILADQGYRGTFLPAVWDSLPQPKLFLNQLKLKAGLPEDHWSATLKIARYTVEMVK